MVIYVRRDEKNFGPYPLETVKEYLSEGSLSPRDMAWHNGLDTWVYLGDIVAIELQPDLSPPPDLPPPPSAQPLLGQTSPAVATTRGTGTAGDGERGESHSPLDEPLPEGRVNFFTAVSFPFKQSNWLLRAWWVPVINFFPPLSWLAMRGWRLDIVRRVGSRSPEPLPDGRDIGKFLADGLILYFMVFLYTLPLTILLFVFGATKIKSILTAGWWVIQEFFTGDGTTSFMVLVTELLMQVIVDAVAPMVYIFIVYPVYRMAVIRFALTGRPVVFVQIFRNLRLFLRFMADMLLLFLLDVMIMRFMRWGLNAFLLATGFGLVLVPAISAPAYFWVTGHLFGQVAMKVREDELALL